jgi:hypothetical protein
MARTKIALFNASNPAPGPTQRQAAAGIAVSGARKNGTKAHDSKPTSRNIGGK